MADSAKGAPSGVGSALVLILLLTGIAIWQFPLASIRPPARVALGSRRPPRRAPGHTGAAVAGPVRRRSRPGEGEARAWRAAPPQRRRRDRLGVPEVAAHPCGARGRDPRGAGQRRPLR